MQQLEVATDKGLIPSDGAFDAIGANKDKESNNSLFYKMRLREQLEFAKSKKWI